MQMAFRISGRLLYEMCYVSGKQKRTLPTGTIYDVRVNGVEVTAAFRHVAQRRAQRTETESHFQN